MDRVDEPWGNQALPQSNHPYKRLAKIRIDLESIWPRNFQRHFRKDWLIGLGALLHESSVTAFSILSAD